MFTPARSATGPYAELKDKLYGVVALAQVPLRCALRPLVPFEWPDERFRPSTNATMALAGRSLATRLYAPSFLTVATYNLHEAREPAKLHDDLRRLCGTHDLDVLFATEAPMPGRPSPFAKDFWENSVLRDWAYIGAPDLHYGRSQSPADIPSTGNLLLSRYGGMYARVLDLPIESWQIYADSVFWRNAVTMTVPTHAGPVDLTATHLDVYASPRARARQLQCVLDATPGGRSIIGMDANTLLQKLHRRLEPALDLFRAFGYRDAHVGATRGLMDLDYIIAKQCSKSGLPFKLAGASDHRAFVVQFHFLDASRPSVDAAGASPFRILS
jgi:endonuclease/exonuclease/phosphatase family metal-dependent hydrolase